MKVFEVSKPLIFRDYLKVLETINEEQTLRLDQDGLHVRVMDASHEGMLELSLPREYFDIWDVLEPVKMCLNVEELNKVLKRMNKQDTGMQLDYDHEKARATFTLISDIKRSKSVPTMKPIDEEPPTPKIFFKSKTRIILSTLKRIIEDFKDSSSHFAVETTYNEIKFSTDSDWAKESTPLDKENQNILEHRVDEDSKAIYQTERLLGMLKAFTKVSEVATLEFSTGMPLKLDVELPQGTMVYYLAPMIGV